MTVTSQFYETQTAESSTFAKTSFHTETKVHRSDTKLTLRKDRGLLWVTGGDVGTNCRWNSHCSSKKRNGNQRPIAKETETRRINCHHVSL